MAQLVGREAGQAGVLSGHVPPCPAHVAVAQDLALGGGEQERLGIPARHRRHHELVEERRVGHRAPLIVLRRGEHRTPVDLGHGLLDPQAPALEIDVASPQCRELTDAQFRVGQDVDDELAGLSSRLRQVLHLDVTQVPTALRRRRRQTHTLGGSRREALGTNGTRQDRRERPLDLADRVRRQARQGQIVPTCLDVIMCDILELDGAPRGSTCRLRTPRLRALVVSFQSRDLSHTVATSPTVALDRCGWIQSSRTMPADASSGHRCAATFRRNTFVCWPFAALRYRARHFPDGI